MFHEYEYDDDQLEDGELSYSLVPEIHLGEITSPNTHVDILYKRSHPWSGGNVQTTLTIED